MILKRQKLYSLRSFLDKLNKKFYPNYKTEAEVLEQRRKDREKKNEGEIKNLLKEINPKLLVALEIEKKTKPFQPRFGDGDEYPSFYVDIYSDLNFGSICLGSQNEEVYKWDGKNWIENNTSVSPRKVINLKQDIVKNLKSYKKEYQTAEEDYGWEKEEVDEVERYLDKIIEEVQKSSL